MIFQEGAQRFFNILGVKGGRLFQVIGQVRQPGRRRLILKKMFLQRFFVHWIAIAWIVIAEVGGAQGGEVREHMETLPDEIHGLGKPLLSIRIKNRVPEIFADEVLFHQRQQFIEGDGFQVVGVDIEKFGIGAEFGVVGADVEDRIGAADTFQVKGLYQFIPTEDLPGIRCGLP